MSRPSARFLIATAGGVGALTVALLAPLLSSTVGGGGSELAASVNREDARVVSHAVKEYLQAYADSSPALTRYSTEELKEWAQWNSWTKPSDAAGTVDIRRLTIVRVSETTAVASLDAVVRVMTVTGVDQHRLDGPVILQRTSSGWKVADYVQDGRDERAAIFTDVAGGALQHDVSIQVLGLVLGRDQTRIYAQIRDPRYLVSPTGVRLLDPRPVSTSDLSATQTGTLYLGSQDTAAIVFDAALPPATARVRFSLGLLTGPYVSGVVTVGERIEPSVALMDQDALLRSPLQPQPEVTTSHRPYAIRGVYGRDSSPSGFDLEAGVGFNYIDTAPDPVLVDELATSHLKGFIWLGGYDNTTCRFKETDRWIRTHVASIAGNSGVGAYFIADEPNAALCPSAPGQIAARSRLVKQIDPTPPTLVVMPTWNTKTEFPFEDFKGTTDVMGLAIYPCSRRKGCDYVKIDAGAAEADRLGIRYWGVVQAFGDSYYKLPTPAELDMEFRHWRGSSMSGYMAFAWHEPATHPGEWLAEHSDLTGVFREQNAP